jgi:outer membrane immunogenic protein
MEMRLPLLVAALCGIPLGVAAAADLSTPHVPAKAPSAYVPTSYNWTGFYVGGHLGGAFGNTSWIDPFSGFADSPSIAGFVGGAQVGVNYQVNAIVFGLEGDFSGANLSGSATDAAGFTHSTSTYWTSTVTGRLGYAVNRALFYGKGGVAFANERDTVTDPFGNVATDGTATRTGWTAGAGIEYALDHNWSARVEYDYLGFGSQSYTFGGPVLGALPASVDMNIQRVIAGINYRF